MADVIGQLRQIYGNFNEPRVIAELLTDRVEFVPGGESWTCAFAPDESRFAWSCGQRKVVIIPWNRYKNCMQSEDGRDVDRHRIYTERVSIDAGFLVTSLSFGTGIPENELLMPIERGYWRRFNFSKDLILATGLSNGRIRIWDPYNGQLLLELSDHTKAVTSLVFAPDGSLRLVSSSMDGSIKVWDMSDDGNMFKTFKEHKNPVKKIAWSPNSKFLCSVGNKQKVMMWDMDEYLLYMRFCGHYHDVNDCCFSPDGALLATASSDTRVIIWDTHTGELLRMLSHVNPSPGIIYMSGTNNSYVTGVSFSPNGCHVASICTDGFIRFWNLNDENNEPERVDCSAVPGDTMLHCSYSPVGGALAVGYNSGSVLLFQSPPVVPSLLHLARMSVRRSLGNVTHNSNITLPKCLKPYLQYRCW